MKMERTLRSLLALALTFTMLLQLSGGALAAVSDLLDDPATPSLTKLMVNGKSASVDTYAINQSNYFKLRDVMQAFDVYVGYDNTTGTAIVDTGRSYE